MEAAPLSSATSNAPSLSPNSTEIDKLTLIEATWDLERFPKALRTPIFNDAKRWSRSFKKRSFVSDLNAVRLYERKSPLAPENRLNNSPLLTIQAKMNKKDVKCLIDTGASRNFLAEELVKSSAFMDKDLEIYPSNVAVKLADEYIVRSAGRTGIPLKIQDDIFHVTVGILPKLSFDLILGMEFLQRQKVIIDCGTRTIKLALDPSFESLADLSTEVSIPPFSEVQAKLNVVSHEKIKPNRTLLIEAWEPLRERFGISVARGIAMPGPDGKFFVILANLSNAPSPAS